jgi:uracil-DNA glycosylase
MTGIATSIAPNGVASTLAWWRDAGVDMLVDEVPTPWLARADVAFGTVQLARSIPADTCSLPDTRAALVTWLENDPDIPEAGPAAGRLAASGTPDAKLMIVIEMPALGDVEAGKHLATEVGDMFDRMLGSIGHDRSSCYIASLCPGRAPTGRLAPESLERLGEIARRHIALAAPAQVWLMGDAVSRAILGMEMQEARGRLHRIKDVDETIEAVVSFSPLFLFRSPRRKADAWADMQLLRRGNEA